MELYQTPWGSQQSWHPWNFQWLLPCQAFASETQNWQIWPLPSKLLMLWAEEMTTSYLIAGTLAKMSVGVFLNSFGFAFSSGIQMFRGPRLSSWPEWADCRCCQARYPHCSNAKSSKSNHGVPKAVRADVIQWQLSDTGSFVTLLPGKSNILQAIRKPGHDSGNVVSYVKWDPPNAMYNLESAGHCVATGEQGSHDCRSRWSAGGHHPRHPSSLKK